MKSVVCKLCCNKRSDGKDVLLGLSYCAFELELKEDVLESKGEEG